MSKPVKEMLRKELVKRFDGVTSAAIVGFTGIDTISTLNIRRRLHAKGIGLTVVKNSVARQAFKSVGMDAAMGLLDGWRPASAGLANPDPAIPVRAVMQRTSITGRYAVSTSLAFGGCNAALVFDRLADVGREGS